MSGELIAHLDQRVKEINDHQSTQLTEILRRTQESAGHLTSLVHRYDEMSERLLDIVHRRLDALASLVGDLKQQPPGHEELPAAIEAVADRLAQIEVRAAELNRNQTAEVAVAANRVLAALRANEAILHNSITVAIQQLTPNLDRVEARLGEAAGEQQTQMSSLRDQLQALESRLEALAARLEQRKSATPRLPDYGRLAATDAIPIPPSAQTPDSNV